jgi:hypothetical protein
MTKAAIGFSAIAIAAALLSAAPVQAQAAGKVGTLDCDISGGVGLIIGSQKGMTCRFLPSAGGPGEIYTGTITKFGLDVGGTVGGKMVWTVVAPGSPVPGALAGSYGGATAEATVAAGLGANVLVGGSSRTVALQPLSIQGQGGLNLAVGVSQLTLRPL